MNCGLTIVERDILSQVKTPNAVLFDVFPRLGQHGQDLKVGIHTGESIKDIGIDRSHSNGGPSRIFGGLTVIIVYGTNAQYDRIGAGCFCWREASATASLQQ